ncbi:MULTISPECIES: alkaline phosphatase PhoX [unclassified Streptomyces]|uniref:alkaline phosphatase PhoX n=1 Tax=unclassified Streptomyces TaxID=2593676 RepID=UPI00225C3A62|nr:MULTISPECIES: alkaline phosphatase PhoX [unclassified Streptomyces]MCX4528693.1 PhoX family protein [Streptomyces sp. NBC_01551]MCX4540700.1 PhoX family protein [Streptomyces sp. NBC_01565]
MSVTRRSLLAAAGIAFSGALGALFAGTVGASPGTRGYGPLLSDPRGLLDLPAGFSYRVLSRAGTPLRSGEGAVPANCDGMAAFGAPRQGVRLVRNHENRTTAALRVPAVEGLTYDPHALGGCTLLELDADGRVSAERVALAGTAVNCAGGRTPWNTWLSCEETEDRAGGDTGYAEDHGYVFEVDPADPYRSGAVPLTAMGRFAHEAVAVDPYRGVVYETEDAFIKPFGLFYRFLPARPLGGPGSLRAGGALEALRVPGVPDLAVVDEPGAEFPVEWVPVPDPSAAGTAIRFQDFGRGGITHAQKLEGCYWGDGGVHFVSSFARAAEGAGADHHGQVWFHDPVRATIRLDVLFGPAADVELPGDSPDNICLAPDGGLMVCEDGGGAQYVFGVTRSGEVYPMARNADDIGKPGAPEWGEFAGVTFSPDRRTMYVNAYSPGTTFAVTGPWH